MLAPSQVLLGKAHRNVTPHQSGEPTDEKHDRPRPSSASNDGSDGQSYENERRKEIDPLHVGLSHLFLLSWRAYCSLCWHFAGNRAMRHQLKHCTEHNRRPPTAIPCSKRGKREGTMEREASRRRCCLDAQVTQHGSSQSAGDAHPPHQCW